MLLWVEPLVLGVESQCLDTILASNLLFCGAQRWHCNNIVPMDSRVRAVQTVHWTSAHVTPHVQSTLDNARFKEQGDPDLSSFRPILGINHVEYQFFFDLECCTVLL